MNRYEKVHGTSIFLWHLYANCILIFLSFIPNGWLKFGWDCPQHSYYRCFWRVQKLKKLQRRRSLGRGNWARPKLPDSFFKVKSHSYWKQSCNHERLHIWNFVAFPYVFKLSCMCLVSFVIFHFPITKISPKCSAPLLVKNYLLSCSRISP